MRIAALSDFHIGARRYMDEFRHSEASFLAWLDVLERSHDRIVLVGDIYQTEHALLPGLRPAAAQLARAQARLPALSARLRGPQYLYLHGNHDAVAGPALAAPERLQLRADDFTVVFIHGHQFDPVFQRARAAAQAATWFTGRLRRAGLRPLAQWFEGRDVAIKHRRFGHADGPYARAARTLLWRAADGSGSVPGGANACSDSTVAAPTRASAAARQCASAVSARAGSGNAACEMAKVALSASQPAMASSTGKPAISTVRTAWSGLHGRVAVSAAPSSATLRQFRAGLHAASIRAATQGNVRFMARLSAAACVGAVRHTGRTNFHGCLRSIQPGHTGQQAWARSPAQCSVGRGP